MKKSDPIFQELRKRAEALNPKTPQSTYEHQSVSTSTSSAMSVPSQPQYQPTISPRNQISYGSQTPSSLEETLRHYTPQQRHNILSFFDAMVRNFSSQFTHTYGKEPDSDFAQFAANLTQQNFEHIAQHLRERLIAGKEWPPTPALLKMLKDLPLNQEILEARHNILGKKVGYTRVEKYILERKSSRIRSLSERRLEDEFKALYIQSYEEVQRGEDVILAQQEKQNLAALQNIPKTERDKAIEEAAAKRVIPKGRIGVILKRILDNPKPHS